LPFKKFAISSHFYSNITIHSVFDVFDEDCDGYLDMNALRHAIRASGLSIDDVVLGEMIKDADKNNTGIYVL
jgi:Ca2+-binding EF-hand superfamily protein